MTEAAAGESLDPQVLRAWDLEGAEARALTGGTANANFLVADGATRYFLRRRSPRYSSEIQLAFDHALMKRLAECGVRGPNPIPTRDGQTHVRIGEHAFELHPYLDGKSVDWENLDHLRTAAAALRTFHEATASFKPPVQKEWPRDDAPDRIRRGLAELREEIHHAEGIATLDELERWTDRIERALPDSAYWALPCQIIHGDFHPGNVHVSGNSLGIFDLDCASRQPRARDLADAILYFCARRDGPFDASTIVRLTRQCWLDPERNAIFLAAYGPLEETERAALRWLVAARWIYSRVHGRRKLPRSQWPEYAVTGVLTPLAQLQDETGLI